MTLTQSPLKPARRTVIIHDLETVGRTVNRPLEDRYDIGLSRRRSSRSHPNPGLDRAREGDRRAG